MDELESLKKENEKLKKENDFHSEIISISAHELRTSLSAFKWMLKMLLDGDLGELSPEQKNLIQKSYEANDRTLGIVGEMLSINTSGDTTINYKYEKTDLHNLLDEILFDFVGESYKRGVEILFLKERSKLPEISIDKGKIRVAIQGLIENAIKYCDKGDRVFISMAELDGYIEINVKDTGIGIPEGEKSKIFTKFFRASNAEKKESTGSGFGLSIIKNIVEKHAGTISFESIENQGTTFTIRLPIK